MKHYLACAFIALYIGVLLIGLGSHTLSVGTGSHPAMYYIIWDMFCGWSSYSSRIHVVAEGESGKYYEVTPAPWGEFIPFGETGRRHYDAFRVHAPRFGNNILAHTDHEEMTRIFIVEECWAKKYNLPDELWQREYGEPKEIQKYYHVRNVLTPQGAILQAQTDWVAYQTGMLMVDNPRLKMDMKNSQPFYALNPTATVEQGSAGNSFEHSTGQFPIGSPLGE